jgi:hypothetical protein
MFAREERERKDCERVSVSVSNSYTFVCFQFRKRQKRGRRVLVLRKLLTCRLEETTPFGDHFPPKSPTRHRFGNFLFPPKSPHDAVLGTNFPTKFPTLDPPILSVFFGFFIILVWFGLSGLMGLGFFSTLDNINVSIMGYYMIMGLGFFSTLDNINVSIMGYYMIMGLGFFQHQIILMYLLWVIIYNIRYIYIYYGLLYDIEFGLFL